MGLSVRAMRPDEVGLRIDYFHDATDEHLLRLGVDRSRLPPRADWQAWYAEDYLRPIEQRQSFTLVWLLDDEIVGFSSTDRIVFGETAFMHLHILDPNRRASGLGTQFVRLSAAAYFATLQLQRLYCQPNAFNTAPNRTLQRAGFRYECTIETRPSDMNFVQPVTRWVVHAPDVDGGG